jgi:hypothetical protein
MLSLTNTAIGFATFATICMAASGCGKKNFEDLCADENKTKTITIRGQLLLPYTKSGWKCGGPGAIGDPRYGCPVPVTASEEGEEPYINAYFHDGDTSGTMQPLQDGYNMIRDLRIHAEDGRQARLGQHVEIKGLLETYYGCNLIDVESVRVLDPPRAQAEVEP